VRTLLLLRHAKSSWADPTVPDHDRRLAPRGVLAAGRVAAHLASEGIHPALVLCSSARRARETLEAIRPALGEDADVRVEGELYGADADDLLRRINAVDAHIRSMMVIGHNPGLEDLALDLAGDGTEAALTRLRRKLPTGALATLDVPSSWARLSAGGACLTSLVLPRDLP
jgi:phosphohistidine phosphatase